MLVHSRRTRITNHPEAALEFTIEARELSAENPRRTVYDGRPRTANVVAANVEDAVTQFLHANDGVLVSLDTRQRGESIATVKQEDVLLLLRVYAS